MRNIKKWIVFALILTFLISLPACASSGAPLRTAAEIGALEEQVADELDYQAPMDKEMVFDWFRYYGTENGYHIIFFHSGYDNIASAWTREVAGYSFDGGGNAQLVAYRKGEFIDLREAYEKGIISKEAIAKAAEYQQAEKEKAIEQQKIREIFEDRYGEIRSFRFYAEEKGRYIIFVQMKGRPQVYTVKKIAGSEFRYREEFFLYAYVDGEFIDLEEAYNNGLFSKETVAEAVRVHKKDANVPD